MEDVLQGGSFALRVISSCGGQLGSPVAATFTLYRRLPDALKVNLYDNLSLDMAMTS